MKIKIATDFSATPGPRYISEGKYSGEQFRKELLLPKVREAIEGKYELIVDLDGTSGYGTSFFEESFGGLIRVDQISLKTLDSLPLTIISTEEPDFVEEIREDMEEAQLEWENQERGNSQ